MRYAEILRESYRTLYHGTLTKFLPDIMQFGLMPGLSDFTRDAYAEYEEAGIELDELVFAADKDGLGGCVSAIIGAMRQAGIKDTVENFFRYGAIVVIYDGEDNFEHLDRDQDNDGDHPQTVEPGDYYRHYGVKVDYAITGKRLQRFLRRHGIMLDRFGDFDKSTAAAEVVRRSIHNSPDRRDDILAKMRGLSDREMRDKYREMTRPRRRSAP